MTLRSIPQPIFAEITITFIIREVGSEHSFTFCVSPSANLIANFVPAPVCAFICSPVRNLIEFAVNRREVKFSILHQFDRGNQIH